METMEPLDTLRSSAVGSPVPGIELYDTFVGIPLSPYNRLFLQAICVFTPIQAVMFYLAWYLKPSLSQNRKGLAWVLSLMCAVTLLLLYVPDVGYLRLPIFSQMGYDTDKLGLAPNATLFSYFTPRFHAWVQQVHDHQHQSSSIWTELVWKGIGQTMELPIFSLAPNKRTPTGYSGNAYPFLGDGQRLFFSLENFPRGSVSSSLGVGYFVAYCLVDLVVGGLHYSQHVDPISGYFHHFIIEYILGIGHDLARDSK
ncbi:hypothetical protein BG004_000271 [Podila humilis]|nr:hypothetical protein BG004_000271 [Podila humilis]